MRIVLIVTGVFWLAGKKLTAVLLLSALSLLGFGVVLGVSWKPYWRKAKALWLALLVWRYTRQVRAFNVRLKAHMAKHQDEPQSDILLAQAKRIQEQDVWLQAAVKGFHASSGV